MYEVETEHDAERSRDRDRADQPRVPPCVPVAVAGVGRSRPGHLLHRVADVLEERDDRRRGADQDCAARRSECAAPSRCGVLVVARVRAQRPDGGRYHESNQARDQAPEHQAVDQLLQRGATRQAVGIGSSVDRCDREIQYGHGATSEVGSPATEDRRRPWPPAAGTRPASLVGVPRASLDARGEMRVPRDVDHGSAARREEPVDPLDVDDAATGRVDGVDDDNGAPHELVVAVRAQPVQRARDRPAGIDGGRGDDHELVCRAAGSPGWPSRGRRCRCRGRSGCRSAQDVDDRAEVLLAERLRDPRVVIRGEHLEPRGCLARVGADVWRRCADAHDRGGAS